LQEKKKAEMEGLKKQKQQDYEELQKAIQDEERMFSEYAELCINEWNDKEKPLTPLKKALWRQNVPINNTSL
jgi:hypothetical protein